MKKISFLIILLVFGFTTHKYYVSTSLYNFNNESNSLQITLKVFKDDFATLFIKNEGIDLDNITDLNSLEIKSKISKYLLSNVSVYLDNNKKEIKYLGCDQNIDLIIFYLEIDNFSTFKQIKLKNTVLFELFENQLNIIHVKKEKEKRSFILRKDSPVTLFEF
jgi:hypothetical protein